MSSGFSTRAIHVGQDPDPITGAVVTPISLSTTFAPGRESVTTRDSNIRRSGNPTRAAMETQIASLEQARYGMAFASGLAAEDNILRLLTPPHCGGKRVLLGNDAYGGTLPPDLEGLEPDGLPVDGSRPHRSRQTARRLARRYRHDLAGGPRPIRCSPASTSRGFAAIAHERGAIVVVDNTFATPYLQQPITLGADIVVHSATKYLGGHSDVVGGFVATSNDDLAERIAFTQNAAGAVPAPFDCYLVLRGVKTLAVRMDRHCQNARAVVGLLVDHGAVERVLYPQLPDHPGHAAAAKQMSDFGGMVSFQVAAGRDAAMRVADATSVFTLAESLGAVESLIEHPGAMTHMSAAGSPLEVPDNLVRLSVGIEDAADLVDDLAAALDTI